MSLMIKRCRLEQRMYFHLIENFQKIKSLLSGCVKQIKKLSILCSARSPSPQSGKKTPRNNAICNLLLTRARASHPHQGCEDERPRAPVLLGIYWVQLLVGASGLVTLWVGGASGLVTQLQGSFCWSNVGLSAFPW